MSTGEIDKLDTNNFLPGKKREQNAKKGTLRRKERRVPFQTVRSAAGAVIAAAAATAATAEGAAAAIAATEEQDQDQNDDPAAAKTVIIAHTRYLL